MKRARTAIVAGALLLCGSALVMSACSGDDDEEVSFGGDCVWDIDELEPQDGDPAGSVRLSVSAVCDYSDTGFGQLNGTGTAFLSPPDIEGDVVITSDIVYTDSDGDTIEGEMEGVGNYGTVATDFAFTGEENFGNGTGGFAGASGSADAEGDLDFALGSGSYNTDGVIVLVDD